MKKRDTVTPNQRRVYEFIKQRLAGTGSAPTLMEIASELEVSSLRTVTQYLETLQRKGLILRDRYIQRGIKLVADQGLTEEIIQIPVFGSAGCGSPSILAERTFDEFIPVSAALTDGKKENMFVIKAIGTSMREAGIRDGDFVLVEQTMDVYTNDLVVAVIDDNAVIKKIIFANNAVILQPVSNNPAYKPIILRRDFQIFGKVIQVINVERTEDYQIIPLRSYEER